jgi:nucleoid DNA-binding protein
MTQTKTTKRPPKPGRESLCKKDIIREIQQNDHVKYYKLNRKMVDAVILAFIEVLKKELLESDRIEIRTLGIINSELVLGRILKHPETKEETVASPYYRHKFKPCASFRRAMKEKAKNEAAKR